MMLRKVLKATWGKWPDRHCLMVLEKEGWLSEYRLRSPHNGVVVDTGR